MKPFLKWIGGKQWLTKKYLHLFPSNFNMYYEPFLGGGSVFFALLPKKAFLADINAELINLYKVMKTSPDELYKKVVDHHEKHSRKYYYRIRASIPTDDISRAARTLYLNSTCFNGIYRVNKHGQFNVPMGSKNNYIREINIYRDYSQALQSCELESMDFSKSIRLAKKGDLVFADPPYKASIQDESFVKYNDKVFSWDDQIRLHEELCEARDRGVQIASTNKYNKEIEDLYRNSGFYITRLDNQSRIAAKKDSAKLIHELFITSYNPQKEQNHD